MAKQFRIKNTMGHYNMPIDGKGNILYTAEEVDAINAQYDRKRMNGNEMEQMIGFIVAGNLLRQCAVELADFAKETGNLTLLKRVSTNLKTIAVRLATKIEVRQMGAIMNQTDRAKLAVSAEYTPAMVNVKLDDLLTLCNQAMEQCNWSCTCTRDQSKDCMLRKVLETVPGVKEAGKEIARKDATRCPYKGLEMEGNTDLCDK